ncbi:MAG: hypothetical protein M3R45_02430 [Pseudomonadota bacterium]|nr:hypothetical protein [Pseudomonadota bacterium]
MSARPSAGAGMARLVCWALVAGVLTLAACVNDTRDVAPENAEVSISGQLTLKGSEPGVWWALTDDEGRVWKISSPTPQQLAILEKAQNRRISIEGVRLEKDLNFEQVQPSRVIPTPESKP